MIHTAFKLAMTLPSSRLDMIRSPNISGPSPVGGSNGGSELQQVQILDEFEYQAGHYNMACAHATLGNVGDCIVDLCKAMECGLDCFSTVRADMDLANVSNTLEFTRLMDELDPKGGRKGKTNMNGGGGLFNNPFGGK